MNKHPSVFLLGLLAIAAGLVAFYNITTLNRVSWRMYSLLRRDLVCFSLTAVLSLAWAVAAFRCRRRVAGTFAVVLLALSALVTAGVATSLARYTRVTSSAFARADMPGLYRSARQALDASGNGGLFVVRIFNNIGSQYAFSAHGDRTVLGWASRDGVWTLERKDGRDVPLDPLPRHDIAEVLEEVGRRSPDMTNGLREVVLLEGGQGWAGKSWKNGSWVLSDDFKEFKVLDKGGMAVE